MSGCIFCEIIQRKEPAAIIYEDYDCIVIKDIKPVNKYHLLAIPKQHIPDISYLNYQHEVLVQKLVAIGKEGLARMGADLNDVLCGFHPPPLTTVGHLHMHIVSPTTHLYFDELMYDPKTNFFISADDVISQLQNNKCVNDNVCCIQ